MARRRKIDTVKSTEKALFYPEWHVVPRLSRSGRTTAKTLANTSVEANLQAVITVFTLEECLLSSDSARLILALFLSDFDFQSHPHIYCKRPQLRRFLQSNEVRIKHFANMANLSTFPMATKLFPGTDDTEGRPFSAIVTLDGLSFFRACPLRTWSCVSTL